MMNLHSNDEINNLPALVTQFLFIKNIVYNPDDSCRYFCMKKLKNGNVQIFMNRFGRVGDFLGSGS
uniref:Uncharacterized protein n=1 Tax=Meloidogyne incognita TaxID=6306 RepID=A0A914LTC2_MELIC